jgi:zinc-ribbon domain
MSDFMESAKNFVSATVSRTSWQAQKQLRIRSKQSEIDKLMEQRRQLLDELAQIAMNLYQQGRLTDQQLARLCSSIMELDHDMQNRETQLQEIKSEVYPVNQFAPGPTANYTPPPSSPSSSTATPPPQPSGASPKGQLQVCPTCGSPVRPRALYCRNCGTKLR